MIGAHRQPEADNEGRKQWYVWPVENKLVGDSETKGFKLKTGTIRSTVLRTLAKWNKKTVLPTINSLLLVLGWTNVVRLRARVVEVAILLVRKIFLQTRSLNLIFRPRFKLSTVWKVVDWSLLDYEYARRCRSGHGRKLSYSSSQRSDNNLCGH